MKPENHDRLRYIEYYFANEKAVRTSSFVNDLIYSEENQEIDPEKVIKYLEEEKRANETKTNLRVETYHSFVSS